MASRAVDFAAHIGGGAGDQHGVDAAALELRIDIRGAGDEGAVFDLLHPQISRQRLERRKQLEALGALVEAAQAASATRSGREHVFVMVAPVLERAGGGGLDPHHRAAGGAHRLRQAIDGGHDLARQRNLGRKALGDEVVLHVDHDQRGAAGVDRIVADELALAAKHAVLDGFGDDVVVHRRPL